MPRGGQAWDGKVILRHDFEGGGSYEYRLVTWENEPRIAIRWNAGGRIANIPQGLRTSVTLDAALYPAIIEQILPLGVRDKTRQCLGPCLAGGNYPNAMQQNPNQKNYRHSQHVTSPRCLLGPFKVVSDKGPGDGAYMIGKFGKRDPKGQQSRAIGFRWNGTDADWRGFPISTGHPIWIMLPDDLQDGFRGPGPFVDTLPPDVRDLVIGFLTGQLNLP